MFVTNRGVMFVGTARDFREALLQMMQHADPNMTLADYCQERA